MSVDPGMTPRRKAGQILRLAGWEFRAGRWWRDGVWATARAGLIDIKATIGVPEAMAFATLAELPDDGQAVRNPGDGQADPDRNPGS